MSEIHRRAVFGLLAGAAVAPMVQAAKPPSYWFNADRATVMFDDSLQEPLRYNAAGLARLQARAIEAFKECLSDYPDQPVIWEWRDQALENVSAAAGLPTAADWHRDDLEDRVYPARE